MGLVGGEEVLEEVESGAAAVSLKHRRAVVEGAAHRQHVQQQLALQQDPAFQETENERIGCFQMSVLCARPCITRALIWCEGSQFTGAKVLVLLVQKHIY